MPNHHFITSRVINQSSGASPNRYEDFFSVGYDTDMNRLLGLAVKAVAALPFVLTVPEGPHRDLKRFGDSAEASWGKRVNGGAKKYMSPVLFSIWNACKTNGIEMQPPQRRIEIKGGFRA